MKYQALAILAALGSAAAQGVTEKISPTAPAPAGCTSSVSGKFEIAIVELGDKRKRDEVVQVRMPGNHLGGLNPKAADQSPDPASLLAGVVLTWTSPNA